MPRKKKGKDTDDDALIDYDGIMKALPRGAILALARAILPDIGPTIEAMPTELALLPHLKVDDANRITYQGDPCLLHVEFQKRYDPLMPKRIRQYDDLLTLVYEQQYNETLPVLTIIIWMDHHEHPPTTEHRLQAGDKVTRTWNYDELALYDLAWSEVDSALLTLAPFMRGVQREHLETIAYKLYHEAKAEEKIVLLAGFLALAEARFDDFAAIKGRILREVHETMATIKEKIAKSDIGQMIREDGRAEGRTEGIEQGIKQGERRMFLKVWEKRFGRARKEVRLAIEQATAKQLEEILSHIATDPNYAIEQAREDLGVKPA